MASAVHQNQRGRSTGSSRKLDCVLIPRRRKNLGRKNDGKRDDGLTVHLFIGVLNGSMFATDPPSRRTVHFRRAVRNRSLSLVQPLFHSCKSAYTIKNTILEGNYIANVFRSDYREIVACQELIFQIMNTKFSSVKTFDPETNMKT